MESFAHATDSDFKRMVGTGRFELPTPRTPSECSTRLSHVPTRKEPAASHPQRMGFTRGFYHQRRSFAGAHFQACKAVTSVCVSISAKKALPEAATALLRKSQTEFSFLQDRCGRRARG